MSALKIGMSVNCKTLSQLSDAYLATALTVRLLADVIPTFNGKLQFAITLKDAVKFFQNKNWTVEHQKDRMQRDLFKYKSISFCSKCRMISCILS